MVWLRSDFLDFYRCDGIVEAVPPDHFQQVTVKLGLPSGHATMASACWRSRDMAKPRLSRSVVGKAKA